MHTEGFWTVNLVRLHLISYRNSPCGRLNKNTTIKKIIMVLKSTVHGILELSFLKNTFKVENTL